MTIKERILAAARKQKTDKIPWMAYTLLLPRGEVERQIRNKGCGLYVLGITYQVEMRNVSVEEEITWDSLNRTRYITRIYHTPAGDVSEKLCFPLYVSANKQQWIMEHMIKDVKDYQAVKYIVENTSYFPDYEYFIEQKQDIGEDGIVVARAPKSPLQEMAYHYMGVEKFFFEMQDHPCEWHELASGIESKCDEIFQIIADSPAELVHSGENLTGEIANPVLFKKYYFPFHNRIARLLHDKGKIYAAHMDGRLNCLKHLIKETDIDIIESFTFPEGGGDLSFEEARKLWKSKGIWANFPASLCHAGEERIKKFLTDILKNIEPQDGFLLEYSEDFPIANWQETLSIIADVMDSF